MRQRQPQKRQHISQFQDPHICRLFRYELKEIIIIKHSESDN